MKFIKWKTLIITCIVCLSPILMGLALWDVLPEQIAIHFDIHNQPDNFASKGFAVFGLPLLMMLIQCMCCIVTDINAKKHGETKKFEAVAKWIIPFMTIALYIATLGYSLNRNIDIRIVACGIVGIEFVVLGNYLPKLNYVKNYRLSEEKARKFNRFGGFLTFIMGVLFLISIFLPPVASVVCLFLIIPYVIVLLAYMFAIIKKK